MLISVSLIRALTDGYVKHEMACASIGNDAFFEMTFYLSSLPLERTIFSLPILSVHLRLMGFSTQRHKNEAIEVYR